MYIHIITVYPFTPGGAPRLPLVIRVNRYIHHVTAASVSVFFRLIFIFISFSSGRNPEIRKCREADLIHLHA